MITSQQQMRLTRLGQFLHHKSRVRLDFLESFLEQSGLFLHITSINLLLQMNALGILLQSKR